MKVLKKLLLPARLTLLVMLPILVTNYGFSKNTYLEVTTKNGESLELILKKYGLSKNVKSKKEFYILNKLEPTQKIVAGKTYKLPVSVEKWDGKSIRSSLQISDWQTALNIQKYNEFLEKSKLSPNFKVSKKLFIPFYEKINLIQNISKSDNRIFPIFGKNFQFVPLKDNTLNGKIFYVDAGHGGPDPGAMARLYGHTLCEDEYAYDVAIRLLRLLIEKGATAYMITRDENDGIRDEKYLKSDRDELCWENKKIPLDQKERLFQRSDAINSLYEKYKKLGVSEQKLVVIHIDSRNEKKQTDVFFYHLAGKKKDKELAENMQKTFQKNYKKNRRGWYKGNVSERNLHMLRETKTTSVYIELGNIKNPFDQKRILESNNRQVLANWMLEGLTLPERKIGKN